MTPPNPRQIPVSVVIPTCNRKAALMILLESLDNSQYPSSEVIIVDSGDDPLTPAECQSFPHLSIRYIRSDQSVCIQRNRGIKEAGSPYVLLCDDDIEMPPDYLQKLTDHIALHPETGALAGLFLQKENNVWTAQYPLRSAKMLIWTFIFQQSIWGQIEVRGSYPFIKRIKAWYRKKGNHISKAGWPVLTQFSGDSFTTPLYSLGAALVKKEWLLASPFDEVLDRYGMGDNYGVITNLPGKAVTVLTNAFVYHHRSQDNRLKKPLQYFRRALALDYFMHSGTSLQHIKKRWLLWSLTGNFFMALRTRNRSMIHSTFITLQTVALGKNPYTLAAKNKQRVIEPIL